MTAEANGAMTEKNICRFIPVRERAESLDAVNFVYEANAPAEGALLIQAVYAMYLITDGKGFLRLPSRSCPLKRGDVFFTYPAAPFRIVSAGGLTYLYISFLGARGSQILESLRLRKDTVLENYGFLIPFWNDALQIAGQNNLDMLAESVLLYTFSHLARARVPEEKLAAASETILTVKKYADDHFSDPGLTLKSLCARLAYNPKYISSAFRRSMGVGFNEYIRDVRMRQACALMERGFSCVGEIAQFCGYSDPLYFSKSFRRATGETPREHIAAFRGGSVQEETD